MYRIAGLLMTDGNLALFVRTDSTTQVPVSERAGLVERWSQQIDDRLNKVGYTSEEEYYALRIRTVHAMVRTLAKRYKFGYYRSTEPENTQLQRVPDAEPA